MACFSINTRMFFGREFAQEVHKFLQDLEVLQVAFIIDKSIGELDCCLGLISAYENNGFVIKNIMKLEVLSEPSYDILDNITEHFRGVEIDAIIGIGGGSILDITKGVGILINNPGKAVEYKGMNKVKKAGVPVLCYPSTAGTGAEVTHTASFIDLETKTKLGINGQYVSPLCGVLVPELTYSCPTNVTVGSGLDAMLHSIEAVSARTSNPITAMLGSHAFSLLYANFIRVISEPDNYEAREGMLLGSYYAGVAMMNAGGGPASGISYPLGVHYDVPHGIAGGIFLPHVIEYNISKGYRGYIEVYDQLIDSDKFMSDEEKSFDFVKKLKKLYGEIGAPEKLREHGWKNIDEGLLAKLTMEQRKANLDLNPVDFGQKEVEWLIQQVV